MTVTILVGDARDRLREQPSGSVHAVICSPPYWGLRDYGVEPSVWGGDPRCEHEFAVESAERRVSVTSGLAAIGSGPKYGAGGKSFRIERGSCVRCGAWRGALGLEPTPEMFVEHMVEVMEEVRRVLRDDGTLWLNIGDSYASASEKGNSGHGTSTLTSSGRAYQQEAPRPQGSGRPNAGSSSWAGHRGKKTRADRDGSHAGKHKAMAALGPMQQPNRMPIPGLKPKDLVGVPWMVAFALRAKGWYLRQEIIWHKPNPMPESTQDRCTKAHESVFLLSKRPDYFYDAQAVAEPASYAPGCGWEEEAKGTRPGKRSGKQKRPIDPEQSFRAIRATRNKRSVWTIATRSFAEAHFATFPPELVEPCVAAATSARGCCLGCGAPFKRLTAPNEAYLEVLGRSHPEHENDDLGAVPEGAGVETIGWHPTCDCAGLGALPPYPRAPKSKTKAALKAWREAHLRVTEWRRAQCREADELAIRIATVLDPFGGAGTTGLVADRMNRSALLVELNPRYAEMARRRIKDDAGMFARVEVYDDKRREAAE